MTSLYNKYRPSSWDEVCGQDAAVKSLHGVVDRKSAQCFLLSGPSGTGKTSLARIAATELGCDALGLQEIDAATHTGIEKMRDVQDGVHYRSLGGGARAVIIDECFARGTLVDTPSGPKPIETLRPGDYVLGAKGIQIVQNMMPKKVDISRIVVLRLEDGSSKIVSREHPFLTFFGWVKAEDLHAKRIPTTSCPSLLAYLCDLWDSVYEQKTRNIILRKMLQENLRCLWHEILLSTKCATTNLFTTMWKQISWFEKNRTAFVRTSSQTAFGNSIEYAEEPQEMAKISGLPLTTNANAQSNVFKKQYTKNDEYKKSEWYTQSSSERKGWKWNRTNQTPILITLACGWGAGVCCYLWKWTTARWMAYLLQGRYWISASKIGDRDRWEWTPWRTQKKGCPQRATIKIIGVDNPSISEFGNIGELQINSQTNQETFTFYDLSIAGHPSYSVGGIIAHNCHNLSKQAWDSLLKITEEPPPDVYWFFCTTRPDKVPKTMVTRSLHLQLREISRDVLTDLVEHVSNEEGIDLPDEVRQLVIAKANGSARQALVNLDACRDITDRAEAAEVLQSIEESEEAISLVRMLSKGNASWVEVMKQLKDLDGANPESIRIMAVNYFAAAARNSRSDRDALYFLDRMEAFAESYNNSEGQAQLLRSIGRCVFMED